MADVSLMRRAKEPAVESMMVHKRPEPRREGQPGQQFALLDRETERASIDQVLATVRSGFSGTLVLRGGPGVGKTTLLQYSVAAASDFTVSTVSGVESEISLDFGALHGLLTPFLSRLDELPPPQRSALRIAFGQEAGPPPERFLVGLATLTLLSLMNAGYYDEARAWRDWLLRAAAGSPEQIQIMYGVTGKRWLAEREVPAWVAGEVTEGSGTARLDGRHPA